MKKGILIKYYCVFVLIIFASCNNKIITKHKSFSNNFIFEKMDTKNKCECNDKMLDFTGRKVNYNIYVSISNESLIINNKCYFKLRFTDSKEEDFNGYIRKEKNCIFYLHKHFDIIPTSFIETKELLLFDFNCKTDSTWKTSLGRYGSYNITFKNKLFDYNISDTIFVFNFKKIEPIISDVINLKQIYVSEKYGIIKVIISPPFSKDVECKF